MNLEEEMWFRALALHLPEEVYHQVKDKCQEYIEAKCKEQRKIDIKAIYESTRINILVNGIKSKTMAEIINDAPLVTEE